MSTVDGGIIFVGSVIVITYILCIVVALLKFKVLHRDRFERISIVFFPAKATISASVILSLILNATLSNQWLLYSLENSAPIVIKSVIVDGLLMPLAFFTSSYMLAAPLSDLVVLAPSSSKESGSAPPSRGVSTSASPHAVGSDDEPRRDGGEFPSRTAPVQSVPLYSDAEESEGERERDEAAPAGDVPSRNRAARYSTGAFNGSASELEGSSTTSSPYGAGYGYANLFGSSDTNTAPSWSANSRASMNPDDGGFSAAAATDPSSAADGSWRPQQQQQRRRRRRASSGGERSRHFSSFWHVQMRTAAAYFNGTRLEEESEQPWEKTARWNLLLRTRPILVFLFVVTGAMVGFGIAEARTTNVTSSGSTVRCRSIDSGNVDLSSCLTDVRASDAMPSHYKIVRPRVFDAMAFLLAAVFLIMWTRQGIASMRAIRHVVSRRTFRRTFFLMYALLLLRMLFIGLLLLETSRRGVQNAILTVVVEALDLTTLMALLLRVATSSSPERLFPGLAQVIVAARTKLCCCCAWGVESGDAPRFAAGSTTAFGATTTGIFGVAAERVPTSSFSSAHGATELGIIGGTGDSSVAAGGGTTSIGFGDSEPPIQYSPQSPVRAAATSQAEFASPVIFGARHDA